MSGAAFRSLLAGHCHEMMAGEQHFVSFCDITVCCRNSSATRTQHVFGCVVRKCWRRVLQRTVGEECWREVLGNGVREKCWREAGQ